MANGKSNVTETQHLTARLPVDLAERLQLLADANDRTLSAEVRQAVRAHVERQEKAAA